ncbi:hypothetical protein JB92DRAFT_3000683 [Gautieria morchelliformis]|nr:hypothetical protein JB92DRAFT_3000683 [Gautieria morchelliformis]
MITPFDQMYFFVSMADRPGSVHITCLVGHHGHIHAESFVRSRVATNRASPTITLHY